MKQTIMGQQRPRPLFFLAALLATTLASYEPIRAQSRAGNVEAGRALARAWCAECHRIEPGAFGIFDADFIEVANLPSTTALSLRVFLHSNHEGMPNFSLKPTEADDVIAYILSLKRK